MNCDTTNAVMAKASLVSVHEPLDKVCSECMKLCEHFDCKKLPTLKSPQECGSEELGPLFPSTLSGVKRYKCLACPALFTLPFAVCKAGHLAYYAYVDLICESFSLGANEFCFNKEAVPVVSSVSGACKPTLFGVSVYQLAKWAEPIAKPVVDSLLAAMKAVGAVHGEASADELRRSVEELAKKIQELQGHAGVPHGIDVWLASAIFFGILISTPLTPLVLSTVASAFVSAGIRVAYLAKNAAKFGTSIARRLAQVVETLASREALSTALVPAAEATVAVAVVALTVYSALEYKKDDDMKHLLYAPALPYLLARGDVDAASVRGALVRFANAYRGAVKGIVDTAIHKANDGHIDPHELWYIYVSAVNAASYADVIEQVSSSILVPERCTEVIDCVAPSIQAGRKLFKHVEYIQVDLERLAQLAAEPHEHEEKVSAAESLLNVAKGLLGWFGKLISSSPLGSVLGALIAGGILMLVYQLLFKAVGLLSDES